MQLCTNFVVVFKGDLQTNANYSLQYTILFSVTEKVYHLKQRYIPLMVIGVLVPHSCERSHLTVQQHFICKKQEAELKHVGIPPILSMVTHKQARRIQQMIIIAFSIFIINISFVYFFFLCLCTFCTFDM